MPRFTFSLVALFMPIMSCSICVNAAAASTPTPAPATAITSPSAVTLPAGEPAFLFRPDFSMPPAQQSAPAPQAHEIDLTHNAQPTRYHNPNFPASDPTICAQNTPNPTCNGAAQMLAAIRRLKANNTDAKNNKKK